MKYQKIFFFLVLIVSLSSCDDKSELAAELICNCNSDLVEYVEKLDKYKTANDVNSIASMQEEGEILKEDAKKCFENMEKELGGKLMNNKDFEIKVKKLLAENCPKVLKYYNKVSSLKE